jgi:hypothetical protein
VADEQMPYFRSKLQEVSHALGALASDIRRAENTVEVKHRVLEEFLERLNGHAVQITARVQGIRSGDGGIIHTYDPATFGREGDWLPPDRYLIETAHESVDGLMAWIVPQYNPQDTHYYVFARTIAEVSDQEIIESTP